MKPVLISAERLSRSPRALSQSASDALVQRTRFADLPLPARLLLAVPRVRGHADKVPIAERYVLDTLGRIIDAGPERSQTIQAVNILSEVLLSPVSIRVPDEPGGSEWLTAVENLVLCVLCKVRSGDLEQANELANHWLSKPSVASFNNAAVNVCGAECFKRGGPHVFTPSLTASTQPVVEASHHSVVKTNELSLGERLLLNALRLRMRTLSYAQIGARVVPLLREQLALPRIEALLDAPLVEALQYGYERVDVRCLCSTEISSSEAHFLAAMASFSTGDSATIERQLCQWLPEASVARLLSRTDEFQSIVLALGAAMPMRQWNMSEIRTRGEHYRGDCEHVSEPPMIH